MQLAQGILCRSIWHLACGHFLLIGNGSKKEGRPSRQEVDKGGLVCLKYTYRFRKQIGDTDDDSVEAIELKCNEVLGNFVKKEDEALTTAFRD